MVEVPARRSQTDRLLLLALEAGVVVVAVAVALFFMGLAGLRELPVVLAIFVLFVAVNGVLWIAALERASGRRVRQIVFTVAQGLVLAAVGVLIEMTADARGSALWPLLLVGLVLLVLAAYQAVFSLEALQNGERVSLAYVSMTSKDEKRALVARAVITIVQVATAYAVGDGASFLAARLDLFIGAALSFLLLLVGLFLVLRFETLSNRQSGVVTFWVTSIAAIALIIWGVNALLGWLVPPLAGELFFVDLFLLVIWGLTSVFVSDKILT